LKQSAREIYSVKRVASVPLAFAVVALIAGASGRAVARSPKWHAVDAAMIEFGVEDTDLRLVHLECSRGLLEMIGPIPQIESDLFQGGEHVEIGFQAGGSKSIRKANAFEMGDGMNYGVTLDTGDPVLKALRSGRTVIISRGRARYTLSGRGGTGLISCLIDECSPGTGRARPTPR
jgi:hypothetical protein